MKSIIVFADTEENSKRGTLRGLVILPIYIILTLIWYLATRKIIYKNSTDNVSNFRLILSLMISGILIVSALGVQVPDTRKKAVVYGALVGFVVYGISNSVLLATSNKWGYALSLVDTAWGITSTSLLAYILYEIVQKWPNTFRSV